MGSGLWISNLRVLRTSVGYLFLSKFQHEDTEITESTRRDSFFTTDSQWVRECLWYAFQRNDRDSGLG